MSRPRKISRDGAVVRFAPSEPSCSARLVCWHHAGGSANVYRDWAGALPGIEVAGIELPGRGMRLNEPCKLDVASALDDVMPSLMRFVGDKPFAFWGHSMGSVLAYEAARRLREQGDRTPEHLFLASPPARPAEGTPRHALPDAEFLAFLRELDGTPPAILAERELLARLLPVLRADFRIVDTYAGPPEARIETPITMLVGAEDRRACDRVADWTRSTSGSFEDHRFAGGHFFFQTHSEPVLALLAARL